MQFYEVAKPEDIDYPYSKYIHQEYIDADKEFDCWFIEDPVKKTLVKKVEYTLNPLETYEFIIVLKSPIIKKTHFLITNVIVEDLESNYFHKIFAFGSLDIPKL